MVLKPDIVLEMVRTLIQTYLGLQ